MAAYIAARWGVVCSHSGGLKLLHRLGFEYRRPESLPARADEGKQAAFIAAYEALLNGLAADEAVYFADAVHPEYQSRPVHGWVRKGDKVALRRTSGRQRLNLHAALDLETFHCPLVEVEWIDAASTITLLEKLEAANPDKRRIHVILDNARYHHARVARHWLERPDCRIELVFLPAYAPHLNAIEPAYAPHLNAIERVRWVYTMGRPAPESDPQQVPSQLRALRRRHLRFLPPTIAQRVENLARHHHRQLHDHIPQRVSGSGVRWVYFKNDLSTRHDAGGFIDKLSGFPLSFVN